MQRLVRVNENTWAGPLQARYYYNANGAVVRQVHGNGMVTEYTHNLAGLVTEVVNFAADGTVLSQFEYEYLLDGNIAVAHETVIQPCGDEVSRMLSYVYDAARRMTREQEIIQGWIDGAFVSGTKSRVYEFDGRGNRITMTTTGRGLFSEYHNYTTTYEYNLLNQLLTEVRTVRDGANSGQVETTVYTYDANGNQLTRITTGYTPSSLDALFGRMLLGTMFGRHSRPKTEVTEYNAWNQIVRTENENFTTYYAYRADGLRHSKTVSGRGISGQQTVVHIWDGTQIIAEMQGSNPNNMAVVNRFIRGLGGRLIRSQQHGWYLHNAKGHVTQRISDDNNRGGTATILHAYWFSAFGVELNQDRDNHNPFRFNGEYYDFSTGRQYLRARSYDASTGRFVSPDPHWGIHNMIFGDNPVEMNDRLVPDTWAIKQTGNLYAYCMNNPVKFVDPSGHIAVPIILIPAAIANKGLIGLYITGLGFMALTLVESFISAVRSVVNFVRNLNPFRSSTTTTPAPTAEVPDIQTLQINAIAIRDAFVDYINTNWSSRNRNDASTVVVGFDKTTGVFAVGVKLTTLHGNALCAEDIAVEQLLAAGSSLENIIMTPAIRPRTGEVIRVCHRCQISYNPSNFVPGITYVPGGRWDQWGLMN